MARRRHKVGSKRGYLIRAGRHSKAAAASSGKKREGHLMIAKGYRVAAGGSASHSKSLHVGRKRRKKSTKRHHHGRKKGKR